VKKEKKEETASSHHLPQLLGTPHLDLTVGGGLTELDDVSGGEDEEFEEEGGGGAAGSLFAREIGQRLVEIEREKRE
jgi:hypothetical protein